MNIGNAIMQALITSPLHGLLGEGMAVIALRGRKSGREIRTPVNVIRQPPGYLITSLRARTWWRNLRGGAPVELQQGARRQSLTGTVTEDPAAVRAALEALFRAQPGLARFFQVQVDSSGAPDPVSLDQLARERVIIHLE